MEIFKNFRNVFFIVLFLCGQISGQQYLNCSKDASRRNLQLLRYISYHGGDLFFIVSFAVISGNDTITHKYVEEVLLNKEIFDRSVIVGVKKRKFLLFTFGLEERNALPVLQKVEVPTLYDQNRTCTDFDDSIQFFKAGETRFKKIVNYAPTLLYGCMIKSVNKMFKAEKSAILIANNFDGSSFINQTVIDILSFKHDMTNLNYSMFEVKGFCICDHVVDYLECGYSNAVPENSSAHLLVIFVCFTLIFLYIGTRIFKLNDLRKVCRMFRWSKNSVHPVI